MNRRMLTLAVLSALLLTACSGGSEAPEPIPPITTTPAPSTPNAPSTEPSPSSSSSSATSTPEESPTPAVTTTPEADPTTAAPPSAAPATPTPTPAAEPAAPAPAGGNNPAGHTDPTSLTVMVNKLNPLVPASYHPQDLKNLTVPITREGLTLRAPAADAASQLFSAARAEGINLSVVSAYRSYDYQTSTYDHWVGVHGKAGADQVSARPGFSEHQTGLAMDVVGSDGACTLDQCFANTAAGQWVAQNATDYGWVIRYPKGAEHITGYSYEPWHLRYVGVEQAQQVKAAGGVLETAWGFSEAPDYR